MAAELLQLQSIRKTYPGVVALDDVHLSVAPGEVVGLIGENGAGKSTLMKVLGGVVQPSSGIIRIDGEPRPDFRVPDAIAAGIAFVHQELNLFDNLDVAANVFIGREPLSGGPLRLIDRKAMIGAVEPLLRQLDVDFAPGTPVAELSLAQRQLVEIAKALSLQARLVIMDEPTSSLTIRETGRLLAVIDDLKRQGIGVIFISHRLNEVERCADRVIVLRDGKSVGELAGGDIRHDRMIRLMIGRDLKATYNPPRAPPGAPVLAITGLRTTAYPDHAVDLELRGGEILGLAGLVGSGRTELARAIFGIDQPIAGALRLDGEPIRIATPRQAIERGIYLAPEDRKASGLLLDVSIAGNVSLPSLRSLSRFGLVRRGPENELAERQRRRLNIKTADVATEVGALSGGNQQKVVLARWLAMTPRVVIFDEPTRGIDVGAKSEIYALMRGLADDGAAILMISSDMEEVIGVSDRIAVMHEGAISGFLDRGDFSEQNVLLLAVGHKVH
jgi:ribose transport system ATP-binding protein